MPRIGLSALSRPFKAPPLKVSCSAIGISKPFLGAEEQAEREAANMISVKMISIGCFIKTSLFG
jgi:hypothetical protein